MTWRCSECGINRKTAEVRRALAGLPRLLTWAVTCGAPDCQRSRELRLLRERYGKGSGYRYRMPPGWCCSECRCSPAEAHRKREARGMYPLMPGVLTCTPECARARRERLVAERRPQVEGNQRAQRARTQARLRADPSVQALAARVRELRTAAGLSQAALARQAGIPRSAVTMLEGGRYRPSPAALSRLAKALHTSTAGLARARRGGSTKSKGP